jgi:flagellar hook-length control protein FliK
VTLRELPQAAEAAIRLSVRDNRTLAQITVHPEELGPVEIKLRYDENGGITASIHAGSAEAARTLADAAPDLRRALETQGLSLLGLDVSSDGRDAERGRDVPEAPQGLRREPAEPDGEPAEQSIPARIPNYIPNPGAHVDVLA